MHCKALDPTEGLSVGDTFFSFSLLRAQSLFGSLRGDVLGFLCWRRLRFGGSVGVGVGGIVAEITNLFAAST